MSEFVCRLVSSRDELAIHMRIRHQVFVREQAMFAGSDRDAQDSEPPTLHVLGIWGGAAAGAVRLFPTDASAETWQGDRLAVLQDYRAHGLGKPLVRFAVQTAADRGGHTMYAHIQLANVHFFERLGWETVGAPEDYCGRPHQLMVISLRPYANVGPQDQVYDHLL
jgi:putative N-acetyltransferase (TIGR04045 family)